MEQLYIIQKFSELTFILRGFPPNFIYLWF
jgi:hypothetical protein